MPIRERASRVALEPFPQDIRTRLLNAPMPSQEGIQAAMHTFKAQEDSWRESLDSFGSSLKKTVEGNVRGFQRLRQKLEVVSHMPQDSAILPEELVTVRQEALDWLLLSVYRRKNRGAKGEEFASQVKTVSPLSSREKDIYTDKALLWLGVLQDLTPGSEYELNVELFDLQHRLEAIRDGTKIDQPNTLQDFVTGVRHVTQRLRRQGK